MEKRWESDEARRRREVGTGVGHELVRREDEDSFLLGHRRQQLRKGQKEKRGEGHRHGGIAEPVPNKERACGQRKRLRLASSRISQLQVCPMVEDTLNS